MPSGTGVGSAVGFTVGIDVACPVGETVCPPVFSGCFVGLTVTFAVGAAPCPLFSVRTFFTTTVITVFFFLFVFDRTVILAMPARQAVSFPFDETFTTFFFDDLYVTFLYFALFGLTLTDTFSLKESPFFNVSFFFTFLIVTDFTFAFAFASADAGSFSESPETISPIAAKNATTLFVVCFITKTSLFHNIHHYGYYTKQRGYKTMYYPSKRLHF